MTAGDETAKRESAANECTHRWRTCPVHSNPDGTVPSMLTVTTCIYGGAPLKDGGEWNDDTSREVWDRVWARLLP